MRVSEAALALITRVNTLGETEYLTQWNKKWQAYSLIGGHRNPGESFRDCCIREIEEELRMKRDVDFTVADEPVGPRHVYTAESKSSRVMTQYEIELFAVKLFTSPSLDGAKGMAHNRWIPRREINFGVAADGLPIAEQVRRLLGHSLESYTNG